MIDMNEMMKKAQELSETMSKKEIKHLESEAWEDFLDMNDYPGWCLGCQ